MDVNNLYTAQKHEEGAEFQIKDENGEEIDAFITVAGLDSKMFRAAKSEMMRKMVAEDEVDNEALRANALSHITISWRGLLDGEEEHVFSQEKAETLYLNAPFIMDQADEFVNQRANFTTS